MGIIIPFCDCVDERLDFDPKKVKENEKFNGLDIYKSLHHEGRVMCPICKNIYFSDEPNKIKEQEFKSMSTIKKLIIDFNYICNFAEKTDFDLLEIIENQIRDYYEHHDENSLYRYKCPNNHEFYIRLFPPLKDYNYKKDYNPINELNQNFLTEKWKNNEKVKQELIKAKENKLKRLKYEAQYKNEFEDYCFEKERNKYEDLILFIKQHFRKWEHFYNLNELINAHSIQYYSNKMLIKNFVESYFNVKVELFVSKSEEEKEEFQNFIKWRTGEDYD